MLVLVLLQLQVRRYFYRNFTFSTFTANHLDRYTFDSLSGRREICKVTFTSFYFATVLPKTLTTRIHIFSECKKS